jgi:hypothetical protein
MRRLLALAAALGTALSAGCATVPTEFSSLEQPQLRLEEYFQGRTEAWGVFRDRFGNLRRQFKVIIDGTWNGETLVLDERFEYADGADEQRIWTIRAVGPDGYEGTAADVRGIARGRVQGNTLVWGYQLDLPVGGRTWTVDFDDRMYLQPDGVLINHAIVRKFGVRVGEAMIVFQRIEDDAAAENLGRAEPAAADG